MIFEVNGANTPDFRQGMREKPCVTTAVRRIVSTGTLAIVCDHGGVKTCFATLRRNCDFFA